MVRVRYCARTKKASGSGEHNEPIEDEDVPKTPTETGEEEEEEHNDEEDEKEESKREGNTEGEEERNEVNDSIFKPCKMYYAFEMHYVMAGNKLHF